MDFLEEYTDGYSLVIRRRRMTGMTAKYELENCYDIKLDTVDKLLALKTMMEDVDNELIRNTSRRYRIPLLAIRQTLDECFETLKAHCAVEIGVGME